MANSADKNMKTNAEKTAQKNGKGKTGVKMNMIEQSINGHSDVLGSYTGVPLIDDEYPVQDQDDL